MSIIRIARSSSILFLFFMPISIANAQRTIRRPDIGVSFLQPNGFHTVRTTGRRYQAETNGGARIVIRRILRDDTATTLPPDAAATTFSRLHGNTPGKTLVSTLPNFTVDGAQTAVALIQYRKAGKLKETCHILALKNGILCQFEYMAPAALFKAGFKSFTRTVSSIKWLSITPPPQPVKPAPPH
jgi:hypothetical protein